MVHFIGIQVTIAKVLSSVIIFSNQHPSPTYNRFPLNVKMELRKIMYIVESDTVTIIVTV